MNNRGSTEKKTLYIWMCLYTVHLGLLLNIEKSKLDIAIDIVPAEPKGKSCDHQGQGYNPDSS